MILHRLEFEAFMASPRPADHRLRRPQRRPESSCSTVPPAPVRPPSWTLSATPSTAAPTGDRDPAQLYSTYAARSNTPPRVFLDLTLQGRRLRINRTPVYSHPITRGKRAGQMTVKAATATVEELLPGGNPGDDKAWKPIASQVKEDNACHRGAYSPQPRTIPQGRGPRAGAVRAIPQVQAGRA